MQLYASAGKVSGYDQRLVGCDFSSDDYNGNLHMIPLNVQRALIWKNDILVKQGKRITI
jgi:hypothetical protein